VYFGHVFVFARKQLVQAAEKSATHDDRPDLLVVV
jgi:hypothetical protein